ncbi:hypothetical protein ACFQZQ_13765 [Lysobacter koreensis]|uniref:Uncharacterized protein n=1 Tax=Lysobacter koreensis TaxID=266122 RepID=A0ABW2YQE5_9GAMM
MEDSKGYAVFFFPQALEALGEAIKPYLQGGPAGEHVMCREIDTAGSLIEMTLDGRTQDDRPIVCELMVPSSMVRMIVSAQSDGAFGFGPRIRVAETVASAPVAAPTSPAEALPAAVPAEASATPPKP